VTHESVITLLEDTAKSLGDSVQFGYGALEDFNTIPNKTFPFVWVYPMKGEFAKLGQSVSSIVEFDVEVNFVVLDSVSGAEYETAKAWDDAFQLMEKFIHKLDQYILNYDPQVPSSDIVELDRIRFESGRKATGDVLSGWKLGFLLKVPTQFEYCSIYE
jgi:hypothetical protein